jgi:SAM-dependent methyltransferase
MPPAGPERGAWAVAQLAAAPARDLLEIGCGPGHAVALLCASRAHGSVTAIDRSPLQVERARARNRAAVAAGRVRIESLALGDAAAALGARRFDAALAINVNAFWTAPAPSLAAVAELLRPGGRVYLAYEPPSRSRASTLRDELTAALPAHGFVLEGVREAALRAGRGVCVVGRAGA